MTDYDNLKLMLARANIDYFEDWNRQILLGKEERLVKWISTISLDEQGNKSEVQFMFDYYGKLESICPLTKV